MIVQTTRFGNVVIHETDILNFPEGLLGFADLRKFVLLEDPNDDIFAWLQSCEEPAIAFPVLEPELFVTDYVAQLSRSDLMALESTSGDVFRTYCIVTIPDDPTLMTANLKAPIVINLRNRCARQCVLQDNNLAIREPVFAKLQAKIMSGQWKKVPSSDHAVEGEKSILVPLVTPSVTNRDSENNLI
jgi:flagellar assembly factor FliW